MWIGQKGSGIQGRMGKMTLHRQGYSTYRWSSIFHYGSYEYPFVMYLFWTLFPCEGSGNRHLKDDVERRNSPSPTYTYVAQCTHSHEGVESMSYRTWKFWISYCSMSLVAWLMKDRRQWNAWSKIDDEFYVCVTENQRTRAHNQWRPGKLETL